MTALTASGLGAISTTTSDKATCTRCGRINKVNRKREQIKAGYLCRSCKDVLALMEKEEAG